MNIAVGFLLGVLIAALAWRAGALNRSGAVAAAVTGGLIFGLGGIPAAAVLLAFFISSSGLSRLFTRRKALVGEKYAKGSQRDWGQVLANGALGTLLVVIQALLPGQAWTWFAFVGAMAAVNADTWATELGVFNPTPPRLITSGKPVERGTSGGITPLGYAAILGGAAFIGLVAALFDREASPAALVGAAVIAGLVGSTTDSLLGATWQAIYYCPTCRKETERHPLHICGTQTVQQRGYRWLDNDWVNFTCSLAGAASAAAVWILLA